MIPFSSLESFTRESIRNRSFSDCLSVSYTHLKSSKSLLYLRSFLCGNADFSGRSADALSIRTDICNPVSYTHLDVYKRQVLWKPEIFKLLRQR